MFGGSAKLGRGGAAAGAGRGAGAKRPHSSFPMAPPPPHRGSGSAAKRLSLGGSGSANPRGRTAAPPAVEETFNLVSGNNPLAFAMIIRLAPDLVDEIRRLETQGGTARMKFDSIASGNVIDVGGKEFKFTWSRETGDLCDIYEERQSGEDGNGLFVQSGCAWRKLNVQRILDESTKIHVKMLSEEAERMRDSRRTIVLDPGNPSMKSQIKQLAAVETNPWKQHFKNKKEPPPKKRKIEPPQGGGPHKSAFKSGISSSTTVKARHSSSPVPSPPEQPGPAASPLRAINIPKSNASTEDATRKELIAKDKAASGFDKDIPSKASVSHEVIGHKSNIGSKPTDLQSMLINLLQENPKGMSLKALEKAVGDSIPNSIKQIEAILKRIATFQAPGRYLLKSESESLKKPSFESTSSPEENLHRTPAHEDNHNDQIPVPESDFKERVASHEFEEKEQLNLKVDEEPDAFEKLDIQQHSPDLLGERKADNSGGHAGSSSDSGSDSDSESDSSDSGSDSGSPSKSRSQSPVGSRSGTSSDSDSDVSSNSKEVSDEDVDIMSDGDKEPKHKLQPELPLSGSPVHWRSPYGRSVRDGNDDKQYEHELDIVEIEKDMSNEKPETEMVVAGISAPNQEYEKLTGKTNSSSPDPDELQQRQNFIGSLFDEGDNTLKNGSGYEQSNSPERLLQEKHKRPVEMKRSSDKSERARRSKTGTSGQPPLSGDKDAHFQESFHKLPSDGLTEELYKGPTNQATNGAAIEGSGERNLLKGKSHSVSGKSGADAKESGRRSMEQSAPPKASDSLKRPDNLAESLGRGLKSSERSSHLHDSFPSQKIKFHKDPVNEDGSAKEKKASRNTQEGSSRGKKSTPTDSHYKKRGESVGRFKDGGEVSGLFLATSVTDDFKTSGDRFAVNGRDGRLQREYSDLELGELREPIPEETLANKQFEKKNSFKQSENKPGHSDNLILDMSKGKPGKVTLNLGKPSSPDLNVKVPGILEGSNKKRNHVDRTEDLSQSQQAIVQTHSQYQARVDNVDYGPHSNRTMDAHGNSRQNGASGRLGNALEGYGESNKKAPGNQRHDTRREKFPHSLSERKRGMSNTLAELPDGQAESLMAEGNNSERKRRDSSSDENSCSYSKYEKDVPDLKGPIKDAMQYKEYVQEYNDKYDSYRSLNKILDSYRTEFEKLGKELDLAKGRDTERYYNILEQLKESYCQCGTRHKRLKKIFLVLHEELKHLKERIKDFALLYSKNT